MAAFEEKSVSGEINNRDIAKRKERKGIGEEEGGRNVAARVTLSYNLGSSSS